MQTTSFITNPYDEEIKPDYNKIINELKLESNSGFVIQRDYNGLVEVEHSKNKIDTSKISLSYLTLSIDQLGLSVDEINGLKEIISSYLKRNYGLVITYIEIEFCDLGITTFIPYIQEGLVYSPNDITLPLKSWIGLRVLSNDELTPFALQNFILKDNIDPNLLVTTEFAILTPITTDLYLLERFSDYIISLKEQGYFYVPKHNEEIYYEISANWLGEIKDNNVIKASNEIDYDISSSIWYRNAVDAILINNELPKFRVTTFREPLKLPERDVQLVLIYLANLAYLDLIVEENILRDFYYSVKCYPDLSIEAMFASYRQVIRYKELLSKYFNEPRITNDLIQKHTVIKVKNMIESIAVRQHFSSLKLSPLTIVLYGVPDEYFVVVDTRVVFPPITVTAPPTDIFKDPLRDESMNPPTFTMLSPSQYIENLTKDLPDLSYLSSLEQSFRDGAILGYFNSKNLKGIIDYPELNLHVDAGKLEFTENNIDIILSRKDRIIAPNELEQTCDDLDLYQNLSDSSTNSLTNSLSIQLPQDKIIDSWRRGAYLSNWGKALFLETHKISNFTIF